MADSNNNRRDSSSQQTESSSRFTLWTALTGFSIVVLADIASSTKYEQDRTKAQKWAMAVAAISLSLAALAFLAHIVAADRFVGTPIEGGLITLCLGFWAAGLPSIMNHDNSVAVTPSEEVIANTYFFSWGSFAVSLLLAGSFARQVIQIQGLDSSHMAKRALWWYGLCASSFVVMAIASRIFHQYDCKNDVQDGVDVSGPCKRVKFGVALGVVSSILALVMGAISHLLPLLLESLIAIVMMILWCFGVGFITFGSKAPANYVGNFYFGTWASFILSLVLMADVVSETYYRIREEQGSSTITTSTTTTTQNKEQVVDPQTRV